MKTIAKKPMNRQQTAAAVMAAESRFVSEEHYRFMNRLLQTKYESDDPGSVAARESARKDYHRALDKYTAMRGLYLIAWPDMTADIPENPQISRKDYESLVESWTTTRAAALAAAAVAANEETAAALAAAAALRFSPAYRTERAAVLTAAGQTEETI